MKPLDYKDSARSRCLNYFNLNGAKIVQNRAEIYIFEHCHVLAEMFIAIYAKRVSCVNQA